MATTRIRTYTPADRLAVVQFQEGLWRGGLDRNAAYLDWKYRQNPYLDHRYLMLAWSDNELVGMAGAFGACWQTSDGERAMLPCLADALVSAEHRGSPLFGRIVEELAGRLAANGVPWLLDFGNGLAAVSLLLQGWTSIGPWAVVTSRRDAPLIEGDTWSGHLAPIRGPRTGVLIRPSRTPDPRAFAALGAQPALGDGVFRHVHDVEYLTWWYQNPLARYFYLSAENGEVLGYLVAHRSLEPDDTPTPTTILDCEAASDDLWTDLLDIARRVLPGREVLIWARDESPAHLAGLGALRYARVEPTGQLTRDWRLPNLILRATGAVATSPRLERMAEPSTWDLRSVCGRSWR